MSEHIYHKWLRIGILAVILVAGFGVYAASRQANRAATTPTPSPVPTIAGAAYAISAGKVPTAAFTLPAGYVAHVFADGFKQARDLQYSPGGTLLVSDPGAGTVTAMPDRDHNGVADAKTVLIKTSDNPHGLAFHDGYLYVAKTTRVERYRWDEGKLTAAFDKTLFMLPANANHNKRTITFDGGGQMYVSVGSTCNVCTEASPQSATILTAKADGSGLRTYASGLRNAPFMALNPATSQLWATEMGRDNLGDTIPPDEINIIRDGKNYGWPLCYGANVHDSNFDRKTYIANPCASMTPPAYQIPAHSAPLGLAFIQSKQFTDAQQGDLLVAYHGSWNRTVPDGYKVVRLHVKDGAIMSSEDFMTGFIAGRIVSARPVDLTFDAQGSLYVSDDKTGSVYIIQKQPK